MLVRTILNLPGRWLVALAGGKPLNIEGRVLDPRLQFLGFMGGKQPSMETLTPAEARVAAVEGFRLLDGPVAHDVDIEDIEDIVGLV